MAITARDLAQTASLGVTLVAGAREADREISWAHAIELADPTPYLAGGELVMTTGINIGADYAEQFDYVARLSSAGTAALAVDTGTTLRDVPIGVLTAGDELGMPVLKVPASTPFIAITRMVIDALKADELRSVQRVVDQQEVLARATLRGGIPGVVSALADCASASVVVVGDDGRVLAASGPGQDRLLGVLAEHDGPSRRHAGYVTADADAFVTIQTLRAATPIRGRLAVRTARALSTSDRLLVAHAVSLISIAIEKPARVIDAEQRLRSAVTREMLFGSSGVDDGVLRYFGFEPDADVVLALCTSLGPVLEAEQNLGRLLAPTGPYLMTAVGDDIVIVVPATTSSQRIETVLSELRRPDAGGPGGGASRPVPLADIALGWEQARIAARSGGRGRALTDFSDLGGYGVLLAGRAASELRVLTEPLHSLVEQDEDELIATLSAFLASNGHVEAAAAALRVHRHTMRNRLRRIRALLGDDLESADTRTQLWLAIKAREFLAAR